MKGSHAWTYHVHISHGYAISESSGSLLPTAVRRSTAMSRRISCAVDQLAMTTAIFTRVQSDHERATKSEANGGSPSDVSFTSRHVGCASLDHSSGSYLLCDLTIDVSLKLYQRCENKITLALERIRRAGYV